MKMILTFFILVSMNFSSAEEKVLSQNELAKLMFARPYNPANASIFRSMMTTADPLVFDGLLDYIYHKNNPDNARKLLELLVENTNVKNLQGVVNKDFLPLVRTPPDLRKAIVEKVVSPEFVIKNPTLKERLNLFKFLAENAKLAPLPKLSPEAFASMIKGLSYGIQTEEWHFKEATAQKLFNILQGQDHVDKAAIKEVMGLIDNDDDYGNRLYKLKLKGWLEGHSDFKDLKKAPQLVHPSVSPEVCNRFYNELFK